MSARDELEAALGEGLHEMSSRWERIGSMLDAFRDEVLAEQQTGPLTVFRASHDSIVFGLYTTAEAAREHCEAYERRDQPDSSLDWIEDEEDGVAEMTAWVGGEECTTGYVVTALEVAAKYDPEADE